MGTVTSRIENNIYMIMDGEIDCGDETYFCVDESTASAWDKYIGRLVAITIDVIDIPGKHQPDQEDVE